MTDEQAERLERLSELQQSPHVRVVDRLAASFPPEVQQAFSDYIESVQHQAQEAVASWALQYIERISALEQRVKDLELRIGNG